jgi:hypothetical protein
MNIHNHTPLTHWLGDPSSDDSLHARLARTTSGALWFVGVAREDLWLGFADADDFISRESAIDYPRLAARNLTLRALVAYVGEPGPVCKAPRPLSRPLRAPT